MYTIHEFGAMIADRGRTGAYAQALRARVTAESVVLDLGTGPGILTLLACLAGARKVFAVEADTIIEVAREIVSANGYGDRVEFIQALSTDVTLPEKVDVIVSDIHGVLPWHGPSPASILDARDRFLKPGGVLIPMADTIMAALVSVPDIHRRIVEPWRELCGLNGEPGRRRAVNTWGQRWCPPEALLVEPAIWARLDYLWLESPNVRGTVSWTIERACEAHGLCLWFDCETAPGCGFSNSPRSGEEHVFSQAFFPWPETCRLEAGDHVSAEIRADAVGEDHLWSWNTTVRGVNGPAQIKAHYGQYQFSSIPFSRDWLRKTASSFVPSPNQDAAIDKLILDQLVAGMRLEEVARLVSERFPSRFPEWRKALTRVGALSMRYSE